MTDQQFCERIEQVARVAARRIDAQTGGAGYAFSDDHELLKLIELVVLAKRGLDTGTPPSPVPDCSIYGAALGMVVFRIMGILELSGLDLGRILLAIEAS